MLPDVICTCPKTFPARQKQENANAKATRNLRIEHPLVFIIRYFNNMVNEDLAARRLSLNWQRTPRNQQHYTTVGLVKKQMQICGNPAPGNASRVRRPILLARCAPRSSSARYPGPGAGPRGKLRFLPEFPAQSAGG